MTKNQKKKYNKKTVSVSVDLFEKVKRIKERSLGYKLKPGMLADMVFVEAIENAKSKKNTQSKA